MQYYYTDTLAAAWMADKFGMKYKSPRGSNLYWCGSDFRVENNCGIYGGGKYYVHPDSMHLLRPNEGDLCVVQRITGKAISTWKDGWECPVISIIYRNGIPFHWPCVSETQENDPKPVLIIAGEPQTTDPETGGWCA